MPNVNDPNTLITIAVIANAVAWLLMPFVYFFGYYRGRARAAQLL